MGESGGDTPAPGQRVTAATPLTGLVESPSEAAVCAALRAWLVAVLPAGVGVMAGQSNRVAPPRPPFATLTLTGRERLSSGGWHYTATTRELAVPTQLGVLVRLFGVGAGDMAQRVIALWRDMQAVDFLSAQGVALSPLDVEHAHQSSFTTAEHQYENCWEISLLAQVTFTQSIPQDFATTLPVLTIGTDAAYPPEE